MRTAIPGLPAAFLAASIAACAPPAPEVVETTPRDYDAVENRGADKDQWWDELPYPEWQAFDAVDVDSDWYEVYRLDESLYAIYEPGQFELVISYLVLGTDKALLFDTGLGIGDIRAVVDVLTDLEVVVLNSHSHYDHVGGNYRFPRILGLDNAFTHKNAAGSTPAAIAEFIGPGWVWKPFPGGFEPAAWRTQPYTVTDYVSDGDRIDLGGRVLEVLETPGHAPDAICLLDRENRLLFTGDTFYLAPLYAHLPGSDVEQYRATASRLAGLASQVDTLVTAHNVPLAGSSYLGAMRDAFAAIAGGTVTGALTDGNREYDFGDFSIIVPGMPPE